MSDEDLINDTSDGENDTHEVSDTPSEQQNPITYCTADEVIDLFGSNIPDTVETNLIEGAIKRATSRIHNKLRAKGVPLPDPLNYSSVINAIATYYAACDCYGSLYNGEDYQTNSGHWCNQATELLDDYCDAYWNTCADEEDQQEHSLVKHSNAQTYSQRRSRRTWVR